MTGPKRDDMIVSDRVPYIYYSVQFWKRNKKVTKALIHLGREINPITLADTNYLRL